MTKRILKTVIIVSILIFAGCNKDDNPISVPPTPGNGSFIDHGYISVSVSSSPFQTAIYNDGFVLVATDDGIWKNNLSTKEWTRSGFEGKPIR